MKRFRKALGIVALALVASLALAMPGLESWYSAKRTAKSCDSGWSS